MSKVYKNTAKFNMYPKFDNSQFVSASVGVMGVLCVLGFYQYVARYNPLNLHDTNAGLEKTVPTLPQEIGLG